MLLHSSVWACRAGALGWHIDVLAAAGADSRGFGAVFWSRKHLFCGILGSNLGVSVYTETGTAVLA